MIRHSGNPADIFMNHPFSLTFRGFIKKANTKVLEPFLERRQVVVHPLLVQSDGFQSFLHTSHLRATFLQP